MSSPVPRVTLLVPGNRDNLDDWARALHRSGVDLVDGALHAPFLHNPIPVELIDNDGGFGDAFSLGAVASRSLAQITEAPTALLLKSPIDLLEGRAALVRVVAALQTAGALAVRIEESKVGWEVARWLALFDADNPSHWHYAAVAYLHDDVAVQSCGMHAFSRPDVLTPTEGDPEAAQHLASQLNVYQLAEDPLLLSGQTFSPEPDSPRRSVERWPYTAYPAGHACHNPYGAWRLSLDGGGGVPPSALSLTFMPTLHALLLHLESKKGGPLTEDEVLAARDSAPCIAITHRDAQVLERRRGYADLDPERVWEQWQLVRRG